MGTGAGGKSEIDRDEVRGIYNKLKANFDEFGRGYGTPDDVSNRGNVTGAQMGGAQFPATRDLGEHTANAYKVLSGQYTQFVNSYGAIVDKLYTMVGKHEESQQDMTDSINNVMSRGSGPSTIDRAREL